jgi:hypothetical protein
MSAQQLNVANKSHKTSKKRCGNVVSDSLLHSWIRPGIRHPVSRHSIFPVLPAEHDVPVHPQHEAAFGSPARAACTGGQGTEP